MCFIRSRQNYLSRYHAIISYFSRLPSKKIKTFPVPCVYLIPFPAIFKPNFPISRLKKWQIPRPETALSDPLNDLSSRFQLCISFTYPLYEARQSIVMTPGATRMLSWNLQFRTFYYFCVSFLGASCVLGSIYCTRQDETYKSERC